MRTLSLIAFISALLLASCGPRNEYRITGTIHGVDSGMVYLQKSEMGEWIRLDSVPVVNGTFVLTGSVPMPEMRALAFSEARIIVPVFLENSITEISINPDSAGRTRIMGSASHDTYVMYERKLTAINKTLDSLDIAYDTAKIAGDEATMALIDSLYETVDDGKKNVLGRFVGEHNDSPVSAFLIIRNAYRFELPELEEIVAGLDPSIDSSVYVIRLEKRIALLDTRGIIIARNLRGEELNAKLQEIFAE
jgi:hypothetical protein